MINKTKNLLRAIKALPVAQHIGLDQPHLVLDFNDSRCANVAALSANINTVITTSLEPDNYGKHPATMAYHLFKFEGQRKVSPILGIKKKHVRVKPRTVTVIKVAIPYKKRRYCGDHSPQE